MKCITIKSLSDYISALSDVQRAITCHDADVWYRGIESGSYDLVPGIHWRGLDEGLHHSMVLDFLTGFISFENNDQALSGYDIYALMQHYGLPTRLLDWTSSPLTALHFAISDKKSDDNAIVWAMNPVKLNEITTGRAELIYPHGKADYRHYGLGNYLPEALSENEVKLSEKPLSIILQPRNKRVSSQNGKFTLHGSSKTPIDKYFLDAQSDECMKIEVDVACEKRILRELRWMGVTEDFIYQDLGSLTKRLKREYGVSD